MMRWILLIMFIGAASAARAQVVNMPVTAGNVDVLKIYGLPAPIETMEALVVAAPGACVTFRHRY